MRGLSCVTASVGSILTSGNMADNLYYDPDGPSDVSNIEAVRSRSELVRSEIQQRN